MSTEKSFLIPVLLLGTADLLGYNSSNPSGFTSLQKSKKRPKSQAVKARRAANKKAAKSRKQQRGK